MYHMLGPVTTVLGAFMLYGLYKGENNLISHLINYILTHIKFSSLNCGYILQKHFFSAENYKLMSVLLLCLGFCSCCSNKSQSFSIQSDSKDVHLEQMSFQSDIQPVKPIINQGYEHNGDC